MTMATNSESVLKEMLNKTWSLNCAQISFPIFKIKLSKFIKLVEITCVQVLGFVEDEWCFFNNGLHKKTS
jgi:hypothetical protein